MKNDILKLFEITSNLKQNYNRSFPLDGRLVGDIGEALAKIHYDIELYPENYEYYDAYENNSKNKIQIKTTFKGYFSFPCRFVPDYYLGLRIDNNGEPIQIFNGPGKYIQKYIVNRNLKGYKGIYYTLTEKTLRSIDNQVSDLERIKNRTIIP